MQFDFSISKNSISPNLAARLRLAQNTTSIHQAMGLVVVALTKRAFNAAALRPQAWPDKADGTPATLRKSGTLAKSPRVVQATASGVTVGSDRKYAAIHQLGGVTRAHTIRAKNGKALNIPGIGFRKSVKHPGSKIPARPFFPFYAHGKPTAQAQMDIIKVIEAKLTPPGSA